MDKVLVIVGPTAVGKTSFGIECANSFNGEIISGDSIQVYRGLDIGSAKASREEQSMAKHHLIDIKEPKDNYSVKEFQEKARNIMDSLKGESKLPIIVGGTGLYIKACLYDYTFLDEEDDDNEYEDLSNEELYERLKELDPKALDKIHVNNRKRLVRALNFYDKHQVGISSVKDSQTHKPLYDALIIGLTVDRECLYSRIDERIDMMIEDGLINEIKGLLARGVDFSDQSMQAIGYKEFKDYFNGDKSIEDCVNEVKRNTHHFAKRQYTWFNNQLNVEWFTDKQMAKKRIEEWIKN